MQHFYIISETHIYAPIDAVDLKKQQSHEKKEKTAHVVE